MSDQQPQSAPTQDAEARKRQRRKRAMAIALTVLGVFAFAAGVLGALLILNGVPGPFPDAGVTPGDTLAILNALTGIYATYGLYPDSVSPLVGPADGGQSVVVVGTDGGGMFDDDLAPGLSPTLDAAAATAAGYFVYFGGVNAPFDPGADPNAATPTQWSVITPPHQPGLVDVFLYYTGGTLADATDDLYANLADAYRYTLTFASVTPDRGYTRGDLQATLNGRFLSDVSGQMTAAEAEAIYSVYFDNTFHAPFDPAFDPAALTATEAHVITPPHLLPGLVDVTFFDFVTAENIYTQYDAFDYVAIEILSITPNVGPTAGGQQVLITGHFSMQYISDGGADITTLLAADAAYLVYFDKPITGGTAITPFDAGEPVLIEAPLTPTLMAQRMYVQTVNHPAGLVDVRVIDRNNTGGVPPNNIEDTAIDSYTYLDSSIGQWIGVEILPEIIGQADPGDVEIRIETTTFPADPDDIEVFIVPQGGDPSDTAHRIGFTRVGVPDTSGTNVVTTYENTNSINTIVEDNGASGADAGDLFADGHAAVFIDDTANLNIIGDDFVDTSEGGLIQDAEVDLATGALTYRHVLIDTIPPMMLPTPDPSTAGDIVFLQSGQFGLDLLLNAAAPSAPGDNTNTDHPLALVGSIPQDDPFIVPETDGELTTPAIPSALSGLPDDPDPQIFFNVASLSNEVFEVPEELDIAVEVRFIDYDLHTYYNIVTPDPTFDGDKFNGGDTFRAPSGFPSGGSLPDALGTTYDDLLASESLTGDDAEWVQWRLGPNSDSLPPGLRFDLDLQNPGVTSASIPFIPASENIREILAIWDFDTATQVDQDNPGVDPGGIRDSQVPGLSTLHLEIQFRAHDRAGRYVRRPLADTPSVLRRDFTSQSQLYDPVHIWWMREAGALIEPNLEGLDAPNRIIEFNLDRGFDIEDTDSVFPQIAYRLWRSQVAGAGGYDGPYEPIGNWVAFSDFDIDNPTSIDTDADLAALGEVNRWILITALAIDEAGNYGQMPDIDGDSTDGASDDFDYDVGVDLDPNSGDDRISNFQSGGGTDWMRIFVPDASQSVDTGVRSTIWYDDPVVNGTIDANERVLVGTQTIIQEPDVPGQELVFQFDVSPLIAGAEAALPASVDWEVFRNGARVNFDTAVGITPFDTVQIVFSESVANSTTSGQVDLFTTPAGEPTRFQFRFVAVDNSGDRDPTPAVINVTIVDDLESFIENRLNNDEQPILEVTR